ncbi:hypothetical protein IWQ60_008650 [Tieghemiomyces parasiticus]|uniref:Hyaluronan/mRNA-binding protein domain-containing protein n=1 Tax=Tieghemiomyces parasiticus TaxID=78921 RepID=A0A9W7ZWZ2_9FUNG|nr:hypothetical protein IWQ60_008650 [Tieghemiomyces parasiticus]
MSVASRNPFDLLTEDMDGLVVKGDNKKKGKATGAAAAKKADTAKEAEKAKQAADPSIRNGIRYINPRDLISNSRSDRGPSRGGARGGRGGRGGARGGDRAGNYDRHSRTGLHDSAKKVNQGWGKATEGSAPAVTAAEGAAAPGEEGAAAPATEEGAEASAEKPAAAPRREEPEEEEEVIRTLDDYRKEAAKRSKAAAELRAKSAGRLANEGTDDSQWKDAVPLNRQTEEFFTATSTGGSKKSRSKESRIKTQLDIEQRFAPIRRGGFRGDDGSARPARGGASSSAPRGGRSGAPVNTQDQRAFPTLGGGN